MIGNAINFLKILKFANLSFSRNSQKLKPCEYYKIYSTVIKVILGLSLQVDQVSCEFQ